jgi:hypothetical protein
MRREIEALGSNDPALESGFEEALVRLVRILARQAAREEAASMPAQIMAAGFPAGEDCHALTVPSETAHSTSAQFTLTTPHMK